MVMCAAVIASSMLLISTNQVRYCNINPSCEPGSNTCLPSLPSQYLQPNQCQILSKGVFNRSGSEYFLAMPVVVLDQSNLLQCRSSKNLHPAHLAILPTSPNHCFVVRKFSAQNGFCPGFIQRLGNGKSRPVIADVIPLVHKRQ